MSWPVAGFNEDFDLGKQQQVLGACLRARLTHPRGSPGSEGAGWIGSPQPCTPRAPRRRTRSAPHRFSLCLPSYLGSRCGSPKSRRWQPVAGTGRRVCPLRRQPPLWVRQPPWLVGRGDQPLVQNALPGYRRWERRVPFPGVSPAVAREPAGLEARSLRVTHKMRSNTKLVL